MPGIYFDNKEDPVPFGDMVPLQDGELPTGAVMGVAWDYGFTLGVSSSIARFTEQYGTEQGIGEALNDIWTPPKLDKLDPKIANERYGIPGALSFSSPIRESVAQILRERKDEEIARQFTLDKAQGLQKVGVFGAQLAAGVLDPAALMAGFIPIVPEATYLAWANRSLIGARAASGFLEGAVGNALVEPIIFGQAQYEQAEYGPLDSLINVTAGGVFGSGLHVVGGRLVDWIHGVQMKHHLKALQTAINQSAAGQKVQVEPILGAETIPDASVKVNFDEVEEPTVIMDEQRVAPDEVNVVNPALLDQTPDTLSAAIPHSSHVQVLLNNGTTYSGTASQFYMGQIDSNTVGLKMEVVDSDGDFVTIKVKDIQSVHLLDKPKTKTKESVVLDGELTDNHVYAVAEFVKAHKGEVLYIYTKQGEIHEINQAVIGKASGSIAYVTTAGPGDMISLENVFSISTSKAMSKNFSPQVEPKVQVAPLVGDVTDGLELFAATNHIEALNLDNLVPDNVGQLGSNAGDVHTDAATGKKFYVKLPPPEKIEQARQEFISSVFYKMSGQDIPNIRPVLKDGEFVGVASEWVENAYTPKTQGELYSMLTNYAKNDPDGFEKFARGIIMDMWLANWDWAAAGNIIFRDGVPMRIDFGGTLQYRAMGSKKQAEDFSEIVTELKSFLDPSASTKAKIHNDAAWEVIQIAGEKYKNGVNDLALITDDDISSTIWKMGLPADDAAEISSTLIARRLAILEKYADNVDPTLLKSAEFFSLTEAEKFLNAVSSTWKALSKAASEKLSHYKGSGYDALNSWLRGGQQKGNASMAAMRDAMDAATQGFAFPQEAYLWRGGVPKSVLKQLGVHIQDDMATIRKKLLGQGIGHVISDPGFVSTSLSKSFALGWNNQHSNVGLRIKVPKGQNAAIPLGNIKQKSPNATYAHIDHEYEFVLPRDTHLAITDVYKDKTSGLTVINTKVVPTTKVKPVKPEMAMKMAEKHFQDFSSAADEKLMDEELTYSLKESMKVNEADDLITSIEQNSNEILQDMKKAAPDDEATQNLIKQIDEEYGTMLQQSNAMAKGAMAAYGCVLKNANL